MNIAILYQSYLPDVKKVARQIYRRVGGDIFCLSAMTEEMSRTYELFIVIGGVHGGPASAARFLKSRWWFLKDKKIVMVMVNAMEGDEIWQDDAYNAIDEKIREKIFYFYIDREGSLVKKLEPAISQIKQINQGTAQGKWWQVFPA